MSKKEKATKKYLQTLSKDRIIELCLQFMFDANIAENRLDQANERLGKLEDILEKYGIESVEELGKNLQMESFGKRLASWRVKKRQCIALTRQNIIMLKMNMEVMNLTLFK